MVAAMDAVGVDGALLVSPYAMYRYDPSYALEVYAKHPDRFALIKPFDLTDPAVSAQIDDWAAKKGTVGVRLMLAYGDPIDPGTPGLKRVAMAAQFPDTQLVIDHLGLKQPHHPPAPENPFGDLPSVLKLAKYSNVAIKITGAGTLSHEPFPYNDIWDPLCRIFDAFGFDRCLWGTDWTRAINLLTYKQGVEPFRLTDRISDSDRAMLMGGALQKIYKWAPTGKAPR
jgi:predicted TIM-barrel fold metal-dependent hydrolase